ncbi:MAG: hypothetical protein LLG04_03270 [Parachlamydia sp.]|nr:hypothetical protein [Parachlamydia sp.]
MVPSTQSRNFIFCPPPAGKPNPRLPLDPAKPRERVEQAAVKGNNCWYYALNMIRQRYGKAEKPGSERRKLELMVSRVRKQVTDIYFPFQLQSAFVTSLSKKYDVHVVNRATTSLIRDVLPSTVSAHLAEVQEQSIELLKSFCSQQIYDDLAKFVADRYYKAHIEIYRQLLESIFDKKIEQLCASNSENRSWEQLTPRERLAFLAVDRTAAVIAIYDVNFSSWHPDQPLHNLLKELEQHGPHVVCGFFGPLYYEQAPYSLQSKINERTIYSWKRDATRNTVDCHPHTVVIVGVDVEKAFVYFLDPQDPSGPHNKDQKVYVNSYEKFKSYLTDICGRRFVDDDGKKTFPEKIHYVIYNPNFPSNYF